MGECPDCRFCHGNGLREDGYPCADCEGTGCRRYPFCDIDHDHPAYSVGAQGQQQDGGGRT